MSEQLFEVAFSGQISAGAEAAEVRARVGKMFNADAAKVEQLFSGKRIVIKKNIDQATAEKYRAALTRAGAECEVRPMGGAPAPAESPATAAQKPAPAEKPAPAPAGGVSMDYETGDHGEVAPPPRVDPLGIRGEQIADLDATIAPVGSEMRDSYADEPEPQYDLSELEVAPVGADLGGGQKKPDPPPPDTTGITLAD